MSKVCLIDLSVVFRRHWHATEHEPVSEAFSRTVQEVHRWAEDGHDHVAVCIDMPPYLRTELYPEYKAHREKAPKQMFGQQDAVIHRLRDDGLLVVGARGYEADDVIATFVAQLPDDTEITIISGDKDALQLVSDRVTVISPASGAVMTPQAVEENPKIGVPPSKMVDWLALVGDKSDNIPGVDGVGPKTAAKWLAEYGDLRGIYANASKLPPRLGVALNESEAVVRTARELVRLRTDAPIDISEIFATREVKPLTSQDEPPQEEHMNEPEIIEASEPERDGQDALYEAMARMNEARPEDGPPKSAAATVKANGNGHAVVSYERALEPGSVAQAWWVAKVLYNGRIFGDYPSPEAIFGTIMTGRSFGLDAVTSLRSFHNIKGKQTMSATLMVGIVKSRTDICTYFRLVESTMERAVYETLRVGDPGPTRMEYTLSEAKQAGLLGKGGNWDARPKTMLRHRCATELARAVYPDLVAGVYSTEEMMDVA